MSAAEPARLSMEPGRFDAASARVSPGEGLHCGQQSRQSQRPSVRAHACHTFTTAPHTVHVGLLAAGPGGVPRPTSLPRTITGCA